MQNQRTNLLIVVYDALLRKPYRTPFPLLQYFLPHIWEQDLELLVEVVHPSQFSVVVRSHPPVPLPHILVFDGLLRNH